MDTYEYMFPMNLVSIMFILPIILLWTQKCNLHSTSAPSGVSSNFSSSARVGFTPSAICKKSRIPLLCNFQNFPNYSFNQETEHVCIKTTSVLTIADMTKLLNRNPFLV